MSKIMVQPGSAAAISGVSCDVNFEVRNRIGTLLYTSPDEDLAKTWLRERGAQWPGAQVDEVVSWETRRRVYRPAPRLRIV